MNILSIDPGYTSGICAAKCDDNFEVIQVEEFRWDERQIALKTLLTGMYAPHGVPLTFEVVIIENFRLFPHKARTQIGKTFPSSQIIGMVDYILWTQNQAPVIQEPSQRIRVKVLPRHAHLVVGSDHIEAAYKHARFYHVTQIRST